MNYLKNFWTFLKKDTWQSWLVSLLLLVIIIRFIFFPTLSLITGSSLPLVVVESCSMYHSSSFDNWWNQNEALYEQYDISKEDFSSFPSKKGLNKGDIIFVWGRSEIKKGDILIFEARQQHPIIHRTVTLDPISTKGDNNAQQHSFEENINERAVIGKASFKVPYLGWIKLSLFEFSKWASSRLNGHPPDSTLGLCK